MTTANVSSSPVEIVGTDSSPLFQSAQIVAEAIFQNIISNNVIFAQISQNFGETVAKTSPPAKVSQIFLEVISPGVGTPPFGAFVQIM